VQTRIAAARVAPIYSDVAPSVSRHQSLPLEATIRDVQ